ncbi:MAG TPA: flagellar protein FlbD [Bdellovibrionales bacterium]|nr:flagellar protein FlbD [Bdellovibrionales bacterium]|tara:strand:- start:130 stop:327 length:198 start_codon:yes stop_codon:yes gene_type:complete
MLELHKLNGESVWINPDQIKMIFQSPDTTLVFIDDSRMTVKDTVQEIDSKWSAFRRSLRLKEKSE